MKKAVACAFALIVLAACDHAPPPAAPSSGGNSPIIFEQPDPASDTITVGVRIGAPATEAQVKAAAESVIADYRTRYKTVIINSFLDGAGSGSLPYAVSKLEGDTIAHRFNKEAASQRIPTH